MATGVTGHMWLVTMAVLLPASQSNDAPIEDAWLHVALGGHAGSVFLTIADTGVADRLTGANPGCLSIGPACGLRRSRQFPPSMQRRACTTTHYSLAFMAWSASGPRRSVSMVPATAAPAASPATAAPAPSATDHH